ncbi:unnamed protein product [Rangifer tarandus platyrhynchus]|uniref:Uncharacterized protein n=1 Tax=Rangifer tarandus platyrhynchus TaxID=3082113 RepID=A0ABN8YJ33_RANTA|nr:unnamed protein product [Rangifer tarandus platyrhynchus]
MLSPREMEERVAGVHPGQFPAPLLRGSSTFPAVLYVSQTLPGAFTPTRMTPGAASSPGIGNFVTFPDYASPRAGEEIAARGLRASATRVSAANGQLTGDPGLREAACHLRTRRPRLPALPVARLRDSPPPPPRPRVGGRFLSLPVTLCRRSPAPGMCAAAVGPRAGFRARWP